MDRKARRACATRKRSSASSHNVVRSVSTVETKRNTTLDIGSPHRRPLSQTRDALGSPGLGTHSAHPDGAERESECIHSSEPDSEAEASEGSEPTLPSRTATHTFRKALFCGARLAPQRFLCQVAQAPSPNFFTNASKMWAVLNSSPPRRPFFLMPLLVPLLVLERLACSSLTFSLIHLI